jgi:hypothetical protein
MKLSMRSDSESDKRQSLDHPAIGTFSTEMSGLPVSSSVDGRRGAMTLREILTDLDPLMIAIGLAFAASAPGPAGEAGAVAAISFDASHRRWYGVALSAASMIPVIGYLPAFFKIGWLLFILSRRLTTIEDMLPELHRSAENIESLRDSFGKYYRRLPRLDITLALRSRLECIMALNDTVQVAPAGLSESPAGITRNSADDPK